MKLRWYCPYRKGPTADEVRVFAHVTGLSETAAKMALTPAPIPPVLQRWDYDVERWFDVPTVVELIE